MDTKICTSIEQSKKLIELGIDARTADMYYFDDHYNLVSLKTDFSYENYLLYNRTEFDYIPAWSLTALFGVLPKIGAHEPMLRKLYYISEPTERYICQYSLTDMTSEYDNPVDACYEMIIKLKEKNLL